MSDKKLNRRTFLKFAGFAAASVAVAACSPTAPETATEATAAPEDEAEAPAEPEDSGRAKVLTFIGPNVSTLDSYLYTAGMYGQVFLGLKEGLVEFDRNIGVQMAQAESFTVSEDGTEYTFKLREDNQWYDGTPVVAQDYVTAIHYQMQPGQESKYGWDSPFGSLTNAGAYRSGATSAEEVGATAEDDYTLVFTLDQPRPDFVNALVTGSCYPIQTASYEEHGQEWHTLENFQGNGPYMVNEWVLNEFIETVPNPTYNRERGNLERVHMLFSGRPLEAYEAEEVDMAGVGGVSNIVVAQSDPTLSNELHFTPTSGLEWLRPLKSADGFFYDNPDVFYAMVKGVNLAEVVDPIFMGSKRVVHQMYPDVQPGFSAQYDDVYEPDVDMAKQLLADAGFPDGEGVPAFNLTFPSYQNEDYISAWTAIASVIQENLGITLELNNLESGIYSQVAYDPLNPAEEAGLCFFASGKPWGTPTFGFEFAGQIKQFPSFALYAENAQLIKEMREIRQGLMVIEGGTDEDFQALIEELQSLKEQATEIYNTNAAPPLMTQDMQDLFDGWIEAMTEALEQVQAGEADRGEAWKNANAALWQARQTVHFRENCREEVWQIDRLREEALGTTDTEEQIALGQQAYEIVLNDHEHMPLWLAVSTYLIRPYVKGLVQNPYWWGNVMYMKWIGIE